MRKHVTTIAIDSKIQIWLLDYTNFSITKYGHIAQAELYALFRLYMW